MEGAFWFTCLLNFKHIFLYVAPAYFVYLLKHYCFKDRGSKKSSTGLTTPFLLDFDVLRFITLGALVIVVFLVSFGPFMYMVKITSSHFMFEFFSSKFLFHYKVKTVDSHMALMHF